MTLLYDETTDFSTSVMLFGNTMLFEDFLRNVLSCWQ
jgi:hypothetical protein